jgi:hypothetical protein
MLDKDLKKLLHNNINYLFLNNRSIIKPIIISLNILVERERL